MKTDKTNTESRRILEIRITKWHVLTTLFVITLRALQPNAEPMSQWSVPSWFIMTLPVTIGVYVFLTAWILKLIVETIILFCDGKHN